MITATITAHVDAAPDDVFETIVDPHRLPDWNRAIARVLDAPAALAAGDEWVVEMHAMGQRWPSRSRLHVIDPATRQFSYRSNTDDGNPSYAEWSWQVRDDPGGSVVTVSWQLNPKTFWRRALLVRIRARQLIKTELPTSLSALASTANRRVSQPPTSASA